MKWDWMRTALVLFIAFIVAVSGAIVYLVVTFEPSPEPQWHQILSVQHPIRVSDWDEDTLSWNTVTLWPERVHRFNITGLQWKIFVGGIANESAEDSTLAVALFAVYQNGTFYDAIPLDLFLLQDFRPIDFTVSHRSGFPAEYQIIILHHNLESFAVTVTEFA